MNTLGSLPLNAVDYAAIALILYGALTGLLRGFSTEVFRTAAVLALLVAVWRLHPALAGWLESATRLGPPDTPLVALGLLVAAAVVVFLLGRALLKGIFRFRFKGFPERFGGLLAGAVRNGVLCAVALLALGYTPIEALHRAVTEDSWFGRRVHASLPEAYAGVSARFGLPPLPGAPGEPDRLLDDWDDADRREDRRHE